MRFVSPVVRLATASRHLGLEDFRIFGLQWENREGDLAGLALQTQLTSFDVKVLLGVIWPTPIILQEAVLNRLIPPLLII